MSAIIVSSSAREGLGRRDADFEAHVHVRTRPRPSRANGAYVLTCAMSWKLAQQQHHDRLRTIDETCAAARLTST
jgi:hypothetical protein